jgi:hypothetical protein
MRWAGLKNGELLRRAAGEFDVFFTIDQSVSHQQAQPLELALLTLHVPNNRVETVLGCSALILEALDDLRPGDDVHIHG